MNNLPTGLVFVLAIIGAFVVFRGLQYLLMARVYLTCAARNLLVTVSAMENVNPDERILLECMDEQLLGIGFAPVCTLETGALLTYYEGPEILRVFISESERAHAIVRRRLLPESGAVAYVQLETSLADGRVIATCSLHSPNILAGTGVDFETVYNAALPDLLQRHRDRVAASGSSAISPSDSAVQIAQQQQRQSTAVHRLFRERRYIVPTSLPQLDRFTLRGALALAHTSISLAKSHTRSQRTQRPRVAAEGDMRMRVTADVVAARHIARFPARAPGTESTLVGISVATAIGSLVGMALVWNAVVAVVILVTIALHEGGHAIAMRRVGYRDVNVFFVPLIGALTVGNDTGASVRARMTVMLAGPVPGLCLAALLLTLSASIGSMGWIKALVIALVWINALNLLPITPLDGGRAIEALTRPESIVRPVINGLSVVGLALIAVRLESTFFFVLAAWWALVFRRQFALFRLRRSVVAELARLQDWTAALRAASAAFATPPFRSWHATARIASIRLIATQFLQIPPTPKDQLYGALAYVAAWIPAAIALALWAR